MKTRPRDAFDICLEVYKAAREMVDERQPTMRLELSSKYLWRPDVHPRMVEYVSDFALAGERALTPSELREKARAYSCEAAERRPSSGLRASRLIFFRMHYLGGADYHAARRALGLSEVSCADWVDEIKERVGRELLGSRIFPPGRYFRELTRRDRGGD